MIPWVRLIICGRISVGDPGSLPGATLVCEMILLKRRYKSRKYLEKDSHAACSIVANVNRLCGGVRFARPRLCGGWSIIDRRIHQDESSIWNPKVYQGLMVALSVADLGGALWEGSESRPGKTLWQTMDSQLLAAGSTTASSGNARQVFRLHLHDCHWLLRGNSSTSNSSNPQGQ